MIRRRCPLLYFLPGRSESPPPSLPSITLPLAIWMDRDTFIPLTRPSLPQPLFPTTMPIPLHSRIFWAPPPLPSLHRLAPEVAHVRPFWSYLGGAAGATMGYIVANIPGALAGAVAGNRLGAVRDAKGRSVGEVFMGLGAGQKAEVSSESLDRLSLLGLGGFFFLPRSERT